MKSKALLEDKAKAIRKKDKGKKIK